jgi:hypothetical protein
MSATAALQHSSSTLLATEDRDGQHVMLVMTAPVRSSDRSLHGRVS